MPRRQGCALFITVFLSPLCLVIQSTQCKLLSWIDGYHDCWCENSIKVTQTSIQIFILEMIPWAIVQKNHFMWNSKIFHSPILLYPFGILTRLRVLRAYNLLLQEKEASHEFLRDKFSKAIKCSANRYQISHQPITLLRILICGNHHSRCPAFILFSPVFSVCMCACVYV